MASDSPFVPKPLVAIAVRDPHIGERLAKALRSRVTGAEIRMVLAEYSIRDYMAAGQGYIADILLVDPATASVLAGIDGKDSPPVVGIIGSSKGDSAIAGIGVDAASPAAGFPVLKPGPEPEPFTEIAVWVSGAVASLVCHGINGKTKSNYGQRYVDLVNALPDIIYELDVDGMITFINESVSIIGYKPAELVGRHFSVLLHEEDAAIVDRTRVLADFIGSRTGLASSPKLFNERRSVERRTSDLEVRLKRKTGSAGLQHEIIGSVISYGEVSAAGEYARDGKQEFKGSVGIIRDVTFRRKSEEMLRKLYQAIDQTGACVFILNHAFEVEYVNPSFFMLTGFSPMDVIGMNVFRFFALLPDKVATLVRTIQDGFEAREEALVPRSAGGGFRAELLMAPVRSPSGAITHAIIIAEDVSARRSVEEQLRSACAETQAAKRSKSGLISGMANAFKHPISALVAATRAPLENPHDFGIRMETIQAHVRTLLDTLDIMNDYGKSEKPGEAVRILEFPFKEFVKRECLPYQKKAEAKGAGFALDVEGDDTVRSDPVRLGRIIGLALGDALERTGAGNLSLSASIERRSGNVPHMIMKVTATSPKLEDPDEGDSMALALAKNLVMALGGEIRLDGVRGTGTDMTIIVPAASPVSNSVFARTRYTVLLVDDNEVNLEYMRTLMENSGYRVLCASNATEALGVLETHFVDAALLDLRMPGTSGQELARTIRSYTGSRYSKSMPLFGMTAHDAGVKPGHHQPFITVFPKPTDILDLSDSLVEAMRVREKLSEGIPGMPSFDGTMEEAKATVSALSLALMESTVERIDVKMEASSLASRFGQLGYAYGQELAGLFLEHYAGEDREVLAGIVDRMARMVSACQELYVGSKADPA